MTNINTVIIIITDTSILLVICVADQTSFIAPAMKNAKQQRTNICRYVRACMYVCTSVCLRVCVSVCMYVCLCVCVYVFVYVYPYVYVYVYA